MSRISKNSLLFVFAIVLIQFAIRYFFEFTGIFDYTLSMSLVAPTIFIVGFVLNSCNQDYKESEKFPATLVCLIESLGVSVKNVYGKEASVKVKKMTSELVYSSFVNFNWNKFEHNFFLIQKCLEKYEENDIPAYKSKMQADFQAIYAIMKRIETIKTTENMPAAYKILKILISSICVMLLLSSYNNPYVMYILTSIIPMIFIFMFHLIKDIDDPFEYDENGNKAGSAEVDITQLRNYKSFINKSI